MRSVGVCLSLSLGTPVPPPRLDNTTVDSCPGGLAAERVLTAEEVEKEEGDEEEASLTSRSSLGTPVPPPRLDNTAVDSCPGVLAGERVLAAVEGEEEEEGEEAEEGEEEEASLTTRSSLGTPVPRRLDNNTVVS